MDRVMSWETSMSMSKSYRFDFPTNEDYELLRKILRSCEGAEVQGFNEEQMKRLRARYFVSKIRSRDLICGTVSRKPLITEQHALRLLTLHLERSEGDSVFSFVELLKKGFHCVPNPFVANYLADTVYNSDVLCPGPLDLTREALTHGKHDQGLYSPVLFVDFKMKSPLAIAIPCNKGIEPEIAVDLEDDKLLFIIEEVLDTGFSDLNLRKNDLVVWKQSECIDGYWTTFDDVRKSLVHIRQYLQDSSSLF